MLARHHRALIAILVIGAVVRIALTLAYSPAYLSYPDTWGYAKAAAGPLFMDDWVRPAGYPAMLAAVHAVWGELTFTIVLQHLLGLATAVLAYVTMLRLGAPRWAALVPSGVVALTMDAIYYEHALLSEGPFTFLSLAAVYASARAIEADASPAWAPAAGALVASAIVVRGIALFALPVLVAVVALTAAAAWRTRITRAAALGGTCIALLVGYAALQSTQNGHFGLTEGSGWAAYARAAPFADCNYFTPPAGTEALCESTPVRDRGGPDFYAWNDESIGRQLFDGPPHNSEIVGSFGRAAALEQPRAYTSAVLLDLWRYVNPGAARKRDGDGDTPAEISIARRDRADERINMTTVEPLYGDVEIETGAAVDFFGDLQTVVRVHGPLVLLALLLAAAALPFATGRQRAGILLLGAAGVVPVVVATATVVYNWRYMVPALPLISGAGAYAAHVLAARISSRATGT
jgi:4-amino-4-deoxy-L-arabinose transferase-like glycosyltransferase